MAISLDGSLRRKFAVIKLWPELQTAEDECIARLKITARALGLECIEVDSFARLVAYPHTQLTREDVDFVLSLHFETPKRYDIFSFAALWNPLQFFHEWGYRKFTRNLLTHDDFLSCSSPWADDHIRRSIAEDPTRELGALHLYHSLSEPICEPTTGEGRLFYAGINWERVSNRPQRHGKLLKLLDESGDLRIYGPRSFQGVDVWAGYRSYAGPIPFDGVSMIHLIHKAGISLVLSSEAHRQSELMSSRLFESLAAGAVIICDENPFGRRYFGDTLLYIDGGSDAEAAHAQVQSHLQWIRAEPQKARELARDAQRIFREKFALDRCLENIYREFPARRQRLECLRQPAMTEEKVSVILLMPEFQPAVLERHIENCLAQQNVCLRPILVMDEGDLEVFGTRVRTKLRDLRIPIAVETLSFYERNSTRKLKQRRIGVILQEVIDRLVQDDLFCVVGPHEQVFSDHLDALVRSLQDRPEAGSAWADVLWSHHTGGKHHADLSDIPEPFDTPELKPLGFARFLFRKSALPRDIAASLPYLDSLAMTLLFGITNSVGSKRCTVMMDIQDRFHTESVTNARPAEEREILIDYAPEVFRSAPGRPASLSPETLTRDEKVKLAVELAHSVPFPAFVEKMAFGFYRFWLRKNKAKQARDNS